MGMKINGVLPSPAEMKEEYPLSAEGAEIKRRRDAEIRDVLTGKDDRFLLVIGPCSADSEAPVLDYVSRLARLSERVKDRVLVIPRIYTNKPRTTGDGYKGMLHQPGPDGVPDLRAGFVAIRRLHVRVFLYCGLRGAVEMLYPENRSYLDDLLSYEAVGARSVEDQQHRLTASGMDIPVGMKNPTSGDLTVLLNSVYAAQHPHNFIYRGMDVTTTGNDLAHVVLRGGTNKHGASLPNYHYEDLMRLNDMYLARGLKNPAVLVDVNHANSGKRHREQIRISGEVLHSRNYAPELKKLVKGLMVESYIEDGRVADDAPRVYGKSITDACIGWEDTEKLILRIAEDC